MPSPFFNFFIFKSRSVVIKDLSDILALRIFIERGKSCYESLMILGTAINLRILVADIESPKKSLFYFLRKESWAKSRHIKAQPIQGLAIGKWRDIRCVQSPSFRFIPARWRED